LLDGLDDVAGLLGEDGVDDDDVVLEDDPGVVAAAEGNLGVGSADGGVAEEDAGGDLLDLVELHLGQVGGAGRGQGGQQGEAGGGTHDGAAPVRDEAMLHTLARVGVGGNPSVRVIHETCWGCAGHVSRGCLLEGGSTTKHTHYTKEGRNRTGREGGTRRVR